MVRNLALGAAVALIGVSVVQLHYLVRATCPAYDADYRRLCDLLIAVGPKPAPEPSLDAEMPNESAREAVDVG